MPVFSKSKVLYRVSGDVQTMMAAEGKEDNSLSRQLTIIENGARKSPLILVVEDNHEIGSLVVSALSDEFTIETLFDPEDVLPKALSLNPEVIIIELVMSNSDGEQLIRRIRSFRELDDTPLLVFTERVDDEMRSRLFREGVQDYLLKPFTIDELSTRVKNLIMMRQARTLITREKELLELLASERKARQEAEDANRIKDEFLATVSHELRTPLTAIIGWIELVRSGQFDDVTQASALETIERNAKLQAEIVEDLLDLSRIITGRLRLDITRVELIDVIGAAVDAMRPAADAKHIRLQVCYEPDANFMLGDLDRLQQIVWNLLSNAIKFTPQGGNVEVRLNRIGTNAQITICDSGAGISSELLPHVFERFRQADSAGRARRGGLGLGLAIVHHLVQLHGGRVSVSSDGEGCGSTFTVELPLTEEIIESIPYERSKHVEHGLPSDYLKVFEQLRILIVDDEVDTRELIVAMLRQHKADVVAVASADETIKLIERWLPDLMILDIGMPDIDGYTLIRKIREFPPEKGGKIPAVALTAYAGPEPEKKALDAGFQLHIAKPVEPLEFTAVLAGLVIKGRERTGN